MSADNHETPDLAKDDVSDDAIELLYEIVRRAQAARDRSPRALFSAYEDVLAENGLRPNDDTVLHRFLFRMQQDRASKDESLVERFKRILGDIGIQVEEDSDRDLSELTTNPRVSPRNGESSTQNPLGRTVSRRGSFDSFFDGSADKVAGTAELHVRPRRPSRTAADAYRDRREKRRSRSDTEAQSYKQPQLPIRTRVNGYATRRTSSEQNRPVHKRNGSVSSRGSIRIHRTGRTGSQQLGGYDADDSEHTEQTEDIDLSHIQIPGVNAPIPNAYENTDSDVYDPVEPFAPEPFAPEPFRPSDTRLIEDAERLEASHLQTAVRSCIRKWRDKTREKGEGIEQLGLLAHAFDRKVLLKQSLDTWVGKYRESRSVQETERFFARLENRAQKARNLFLLTKAFTHWAKSAEDEVLRTSVARRHILRTRFFNGWREITAVNELKIQHFVLGKFLGKWRRRTATVRGINQYSALLYEENLQQKMWKSIFFGYCERTAHNIHDGHLKRRTYKKWHEIAVLLKDREDWAVNRHDRLISRSKLEIWQQKTVAMQTLEGQAGDFRRTALLSSTLSILGRQAQLVPLLKRFQSKASARLLRVTLQAWHRQSQLSQQVRRVEQLRILRNAWTTWNDRLRMKVLQDRINDRVLIESLYKWTLASRVSLFQRVKDRNLKESIFLSWVTKTNASRNSLDVAERRFAQFKRSQTLRFYLQKIENATIQRKTEEAAVVAERDKKLKQYIFEKLLERVDHFQQLNQWAGDARFYVLATHTLKSWSEATQHARRNRRREAYTQMRRKVKIGLVRRMFDIWKKKADELAEQERKAKELIGRCALQTSTVLIARWRERTSTLREASIQAEEKYNTSLGLSYLQVWAQRMDSLRTFETQALALRQESTEIAAASALKKMGWKLWNVRRQEETAHALHQRNFEKHLRAMIRFWLEQAAERVVRRDTSPTPTRGTRGQFEDHDIEDDATRRLDFEDAGDDTRRLEAWTAFDENALGLSNLDLSLSVSPQPHEARVNPPPRSVLRPPPATIPEDFELATDDPNAFWASTPAPPKLTAGYLKTPSKRSVARSKRPELPPSPEKRVVGLDRGIGIRSAPPGRVERDVGIVGGVTSFERRLREGGFDGSATGRRKERGRRKARVGFGDVSEIG